MENKLVFKVFRIKTDKSQSAQLTDLTIKTIYLFTYHISHQFLSL